MKKLFQTFLSNKGNSLAEFAVTTALMGTLAVTAAPKFSGMSEGTKDKKTESELDKLVSAAQNFYNQTATNEGRGRFPGQERFHSRVGGYETEDALFAVIDEAVESGAFNSYSHGEASNWCSVFGTTNEDAPLPNSANISNDAGATVGADEWMELFGHNAIKSPFQDGHYIYVVIPGGGSGSDSYPPVMVIADLESPQDFMHFYEP